MFGVNKSGGKIHIHAHTQELRKSDEQIFCSTKHKYKGRQQSASRYRSKFNLNTAISEYKRISWVYRISTRKKKIYIYKMFCSIASVYTRIIRIISETKLLRSFHCLLLIFSLFCFHKLHICCTMLIWTLKKKVKKKSILIVQILILLLFNIRIWTETSLIWDCIHSFRQAIKQKKEPY